MPRLPTLTTWSPASRRGRMCRPCKSPPGTRRRTSPMPLIAKSWSGGVEENRIDFVQGVATALTPIAFLETVMVKSYETLVDSDTKVDVNTGIVAAGRLQSLIDSQGLQPRNR